MEYSCHRPGGGLWGRGIRDIRRIFSTGTEVGGVPSIWMHRKGKKTRETQRTLYVSALKDKGDNYIGDTRTST